MPAPETRSQLLERALAERAARAARRAEPKSLSHLDHPFTRHVNPPLANLMASVAVDRRFVRGEGAYLWDAEGRRYTDLIAMYGALPFGHNPPEIWAALEKLRQSGEPLHVQPSLLDAAGELAARLVALCPPGLDRVTFANSGTEAVEAAIKIARSATRRPQILSTERGFHGKTTGALSATHRRALQEPFGLPLPGHDAVPFGDADALEQHLERHGHRTAAFLVEPIQGEGGIFVAPPGYLRRARALCDRHGTLLILDEVQTGLGRTGRMFVAEAEGVVPDMLVLAKALGGGVVPVGAVIAKSACVVEAFSLKHSSTFAGNTLAARAGIAALDQLATPGLFKNVEKNGEWLLGELRQLQARYPRLITGVRGRGYMIGIEFTDDPAAFVRRGLLADLAEREDLAVLVCAWLLAVHQLRVITTLSGARVIRVEPPLITTREQLAPLLPALAEVLALLDAGDSGAFIAPIGGHLGELPPPGAPDLRPPPAARPREALGPQEARWACILHARTFDDYGAYDPTMARLPPEVLQRALARLREEDDGVMVNATLHVDTPDGARSYGELISIPYTAEELTSMPAERAIRAVRNAVIRARDRGAQIVGLGAFTSIITGNGVALTDLGVPLTTGNALTAVATALGITAALAESGVVLADTRVAVVGATGSIGGAVALLLLGRAGALTLLGNPAHPERSVKQLRELASHLLDRVEVWSVAGRSFEPGSLADRALRWPAAERLARLQEEGWLRLSVDRAAELPGCPAVAVATSSADAFLKPELLCPNSLVVDTSEPSNVHPDVARLRPDVRIERGGVMKLPGGEDLGPGTGLPPGYAYACMSETILLALEGRRAHGSLGIRLEESLLERVEALAARHQLTHARMRRNP